MALVPSDSDLSSSRIDHFSSLPNELLDDIFEYAYTDSPSSHPLSKRLLPFFEIHLYRKPPLSSSAQCSLFLKAISAQPRKGRLVDSLNLSSVHPPTKANLDLLEALLPLLPNLTHLESPILTSLFERNLDAGTLLSRLHSLATSILAESADEDGREHLDLEQLAYLRRLPNLHKLELDDWGVYYNDTLRESRALWLPHVETLRVEGFGAEDDSVSFLTGRCPVLLHLALHSTWSEDLNLYGDLARHPLSLESLSLSAQDGLTVRHDEQYLLERFTHLRFLHLGDQCYDYTLPSTLLKLPLLAEIHLGQGRFEPDDFLPLISGPTRLILLKTITLEADPGNIGKKVSSPSTPGLDASRELQRCSVEMRDWSLPERGEDVNFVVLGLKRFIKVARENGLTVGGGVLSALQTVDDYHLEANNRAVLFTYVHHTLDDLRKARIDAVRDGVALPALDLVSLDLERLELVEIDLPERDWFTLSLRNKE